MSNNFFLIYYECFRFLASLVLCGAQLKKLCCNNNSNDFGYMKYTNIKYNGVSFFIMSSKLLQLQISWRLWTI